MYKYRNFLLNFLLAGIVVYAVALWNGLDGFLFAWVLNFMLMMVSQTYTETLQPRLASDYYDSKDWERGGELYESLGVNVYRKVLVWIGWEKIRRKENPVKNDLRALKDLEYMTRKSEFAHLIVFLIVLGANIFVGIRYGLADSLWLLVLNILLNLYPVMVQRYNRPRIKEVIKLKSEKVKK